MKLDDPESYLEPLTQVSITMVYTPRQESDKADKKKLEEQLAAEQAAKIAKADEWLFTPNDQ